jgi:hypothetical protein
MTRCHQHVTAAACAGLAAIVLFSGGGCGEAVQSRANTGEAPTTMPAAATDKAAPQLNEGSDNSAELLKPSPDPANEPDTKTSERPTSETARSNGERARESSPAGDRKTTREISFDTLKFEIEKGQAFERSMLTSGIKKLAGQRVRIRGYMLPSFQQAGIKQFVLVRDNMECCFGPGAALYDCVIVEMVNNQSTSFSVRPIAVEGTFSVREFKGPDDTHLAIFHLEGERVR